MPNHPYKIAIIITALGPGGAERVASNQANYLSAAGHKVHLITLANYPPDHYLLDSRRIKRIHFESSNPESLLEYISIEEIDITIDHIHWDEQHYKFFELMGLYSHKYVIFDHSTYFYPLYYRWRWPMFGNRKSAYQNANAVTALTRHTTMLFQQKTPQTVYMPNPLSYESKNISNLVDNRKIVAIANWERHEKRLDRVIQVLAQVSTEVPDVQLTLVGPYRDFELEKLLAQYNIQSEQIDIVGSQDEVEPFYLAARLCISMSEIEGFGLTMTEAGMHGVPRIAMYSPGMEDIIRHGIDGYLVKQGDVDCAAKYATQLLNDSSLAKQFGKQAVLSSSQFAISKIGPRWEWLIQLVIESESMADFVYQVQLDSHANRIPEANTIKNICADYDAQLLRLTTTNFVVDAEHSISIEEIQEAQKAFEKQKINILNKNVILKFSHKILEAYNSRVLAKVIEKSALFDSNWYLNKYHDVKSSGINPSLHYLVHGAAEGRNPSSRFDTEEHLNRNKALIYSGQNPLIHFLDQVESEGSAVEPERVMRNKAVPKVHRNEHFVLSIDQKWLDEFGSNRSVLAILEPNFLGIRQSASQTLSESQILYVKDDLDNLANDYYATLIVNAKPERILFHGFPESYWKLATSIKRKAPNLPILCVYHGSFVQQRHDGERDCLSKIIELNKAGIISSVGLVKKGMAETLQTIGINAWFLQNFIDRIPSGASKFFDESIGIIGSEWNERKPIYQQLVATKHIPHSTLVVLGSGDRTKEFCKRFEIVAEHRSSIPQSLMPNFLSKNMLNMYVTLSECAPMLPIESLSVGVPCLFGPNSHFFEHHEYLRSRLVVQIPDSETAIASTALVAIEERQKIIEEYILYAQEYNPNAKKSFSDFLESV